MKTSNQKKKILIPEIPEEKKINESAEEITDKTDHEIKPTHNSEKAKVEWLTSFEEAKRMVEKNRKAIMILCTADWISSTNEIDCKLSESKKIKNLVEQGLIPLKIHTKTGEKRHEILEKYVVSTFPYLFFLDTSGNVLGRVRFSSNVNEAIERICEVSKKIF